MNMKDIMAAIDALDDDNFARLNQFVRNNATYRGERKLFTLKRGDRVFWMSSKRKNALNPKVLGTVEEVMRKYVKVKTDDQRMWRVHPSLLQMETK